MTGLSLYILAEIILVGLKVNGNLQWSWWWITAPLWFLPVVLFGVTFLFVLVSSWQWWLSVGFVAVAVALLLFSAWDKYGTDPGDAVQATWWSFNHATPIPDTLKDASLVAQVSDPNLTQDFDGVIWLVTILGGFALFFLLASFVMASFSSVVKGVKQLLKTPNPLNRFFNGCLKTVLYLRPW